ncbi:hypothetical protein ASG47_12630 [Devosia sp. Leaf420]|uniref:hypothetical protein n=1 Tax=Devosia sp. Leaf420 TaxID=1736374 RepID=UPI00071291CB|nr:hypothetical protein [Devosia sp. Leaf420]KQT45789.1 hypothetical protein ASG47_12630 [Devosia sp. Leaf420]
MSDRIIPLHPKPRHQAGGEELRASIDAGRTGDKVAFPDPAAAPLPTDAQAGGTATAFKPERDRSDLTRRGGASGLLVYILVIAAIAAAAIALIWWGTTPR